jgi:hypothetical protein
MKTLRPLFFLTSLLLVVGLACSLTGGGNTPTQPEQPQQPVEQPTQQQAAPTDVPPPTAEAVATDTAAPAPAPAVSKFFTEEFDQDPGSDWTVDILGPGADANKDSVKTEFSNGNLRIELPKEDLYYYYTYSGFSYDNVRIDLRADNRGVNTNNISLTCRVGSDGWYEWSVGSGGDWYLYAVTDKYNLLTNGGTNFLKQGKDVNEFTMICKDKQISMFVNGKEIKQSPVTDNKYGLREGSVGFNVSSLNVTPVIVELEWFKISEP